MIHLKIFSKIIHWYSRKSISSCFYITKYSEKLLFKTFCFDFFPLVFFLTHYEQNHFFKDVFLIKENLNDMFLLYMLYVSNQQYLVLSFIFVGATWVLEYHPPKSSSKIAQTKKYFVVSTFLAKSVSSKKKKKIIWHKESSLIKQKCNMLLYVFKIFKGEPSNIMHGSPSICIHH